MPCFVMVLVLALNSNTLPSVLQCLFLLCLVPCIVAYLLGWNLVPNCQHLNVSAEWRCPPVSFPKS